MEIKKQKRDLVNNLWNLGNIVAGYGVVQSVVLMHALSVPAQRAIIMSVWHILILFIIIIGLLLWWAVRWLGRQEISLRRDLGVDESLLSLIEKVINMRIGAIVISHIALIATIIYVHYFSIYR